jgi:hypothetical protein
MDSSLISPPKLAHPVTLLVLNVKTLPPNNVLLVLINSSLMPKNVNQLVLKANLQIPPIQNVPLVTPLVLPVHLPPLV